MPRRHRRDREHSSVLFTQHDQRPSAVSDMISFSASDGEIDDSLFSGGLCSGSMTDPALLTSSSSRNARLRADEELICIMTKAVKELRHECSLLRSHLAAGCTSVFSRGAIKAPRQHSSPFFPKVHTSSQYYGTPPTRLASVLLLLSHPLTALKKKDTSTCLLWMSLWPHIYARPQLSDGRRGRAIRPSRAEPHLHSLDAPTRQLDKRLQRFTRWLCSRSSRPRCSPMRKPVWIQPLSGTRGV